MSRRLSRRATPASRRAQSRIASSTARQVAPGAGEREQAAQPVARVAAARVDLGDHVVDDRPLPVVEQGLEQRGAVVEVPVEAALGGAELARQRLDAYGLRTAAGERVQAGGDPVAARRAGLRGHEPYASVSIRIRMDDRSLPANGRSTASRASAPTMARRPRCRPRPSSNSPAPSTAAGDDRRRRPCLAPAADVARRLPLRRRVVGARAALGGRSALYARSCGRPRAATHVRFAGLDGHWSVMLLEDALADDVLLADHLDGAPLDAKHGAPVRLVAPAHYGFVNVKHLCRIELLTAEPAQSTAPPRASPTSACGCSATGASRARGSGRRNATGSSRRGWSASYPAADPGSDGSASRADRPRSGEHRGVDAVALDDRIGRQAGAAGGEDGGRPRAPRPLTADVSAA